MAVAWSNQYCCRLTPPSRGPACGRPLTSNVRPTAGRTGPVHLKRLLPMPVSQGLGLDALCSWKRRARFSVGVGCPSFGGQRTVGGRFSLPSAKLVQRLKPWRYVTAQQCLRSRPELVVGAATGTVLPPWLAGQTEAAPVPVLHSQASVGRVASPSSSGPSALHGKSITVGVSPVPNPSVKGTSRRRAAPYVER